MKKLPSWLSAKNLYIAGNLVNQGFRYCERSDDFSEGYYLEGFEDWDLFSPYGGFGLDLVCDRALFFLDLEDSELTCEHVLEHALNLISLFSYEWQHDSPNHRQLQLLAA